MYLSIVIPAYNEEKRIIKSLDKILKFLKNKAYKWEIIVVSDGSKDHTVDIVRKIKNKNVSVLSYKKNKGKGFAVRKGMMKAKGKIILFSDADLSTPIKEIDRFIPYLEKGYDIVIGSRNQKDSNIKIPQPIHRKLVGKMFQFIVASVALRGVKDSQCGFKAFTHRAAKKIFNLQKLNGFSFDVEALYLAKNLGFRIKEVGVTWINSEASKVNPLKDSVRMLKDTLKIKNLHKNFFKSK
ncbi:glycosyltransferase family 2 protein [Candidatus Woesearchaeota archaeon]|nr:glycosyltransferase family 2 protein [Candidatus Woesearchaeota archaeon]